MRSDWVLPICSGHERLKDDKGDKAHPTQKPESLLTACWSATNRGDVVLDRSLAPARPVASAKLLGRITSASNAKKLPQGCRETLGPGAPVGRRVFGNNAVKARSAARGIRQLVERGLLRPEKCLSTQRAGGQAARRRLACQRRTSRFHSSGRRRARGRTVLQWLDLLAVQARRQTHPIDILRQQIRGRDARLTKSTAGALCYPPGRPPLPRQQWRVFLCDVHTLAWKFGKTIGGTMRDFQAPGRSAVFATEGMCATSHPLAAKVALDLLQQGGNAVDAAIGAGVLLGLCEPQMTGLGGDCFILLKPAGSERIVTVNGSGRAPAGADAGALRARGLDAVPVYGVDSVTLPGAVDAFCQVSADWGRLGLAETLAPAIRYAETGVPVAPRVAYDWAEPTHLQGAARRHYLNGNAPLRSGQIFRAPSQAEVLRRIAREGRAGFYEGEVAQDLIDSLREMGGCHTLDDLAATTCTYGDPIHSAYRNLDLFEHAPNGTGAVASLILNILQHFDMASLDPLGPERAHLEAEATKLAYDARNRFIADPDHTMRLAHMLAPETAMQLASLIDPKRVLPDVAPLTEAIHRDTVYITVVDRDRMAVSLIYSIFHSFGSGLASDKFGILFQNRGAGFTLTKGHPNELAGGKRPMHTIIPAMLGEKRAHHHALRRYGWGVSACGPCAPCYQPARSWDGIANRHRRAARLCRKRHAGAGNGVSRNHGTSFGRSWASGHPVTWSARRCAGNQNSCGRRAGRGIRPAQGWLRAGVLISSCSKILKTGSPGPTGRG